MGKSRFTGSQIVGVLKEGEAGTPVGELCRKHGIGTATYHKWKGKYAGVRVSELHCLRKLELESANSSACTRIWRWRTMRSESIESKIVAPPARREVTERLVKARLSVTRACEITGLSRAAYDKGQDRHLSAMLQ